jgi:hypothetical protein
MPTEKTDYSDLVIKSSQFIIWLNKRGISIQGTRIENLFKNLELINEAYSKGIDFIKHLSMEEFIFSLFESSSLFKIYDQFHDYPDNFISNKKLREIISGPYLPADELSGTGDVNARNTLFEIELAAFVHSFGIEIFGFDDLYFEFERKNIFVECKRIMNIKNLQSNINKAVIQLENKIKDLNDIGLIALSMDKIFHFDKKMLDVDHLEETKYASMLSCQQFVNENYKILHSITNNNIYGFLFIFKFFAQIREEKIAPYHCFSPIIYPIHSQNMLKIY